MQKTKRFSVGRFFLLLGKLLLSAVIFSVLLVAIYTVMHPPITPLMLIRPIEGLFSGEFVGIDRDWKIGDPPTDISLHKNSPGYRLILNNILFPAAKKKKQKT